MKKNFFENRRIVLKELVLYCSSWESRSNKADKILNFKAQFYAYLIAFYINFGELYISSWDF